MSLVYLDSSALVKLVRREAETDGLRALVEGSELLASELALSEVPRAIRRATFHDRSLALGPLLERAEQVLEAVALAPLDDPVLIAAGALSEPGLRSLDAIHLATALDLQPIDSFITYDVRQAEAAERAGLPVRPEQR